MSVRTRSPIKRQETRGGVALVKNALATPKKNGVKKFSHRFFVSGRAPLWYYSPSRKHYCPSRKLRSLSARLG